MQSAAEVLKNALYNEVKATTFYIKAAEVTRNDESRMLFLELSDMEDDHARKLLERAKGNACTQGFDAEAYLNELEILMTDTISVEENEIIRNGTMRQVLEMAIGLEQTALDTYLELADKAEHPDVKQFCQELAREEERHRNALEKLLLSLDMDEDDRPGL